MALVSSGLTHVGFNVRVFDEGAPDNVEIEYTIADAELADGTLWIYVRRPAPPIPAMAWLKGKLENESMPPNVYELRDLEGNVLGRFEVTGDG